MHHLASPATSNKFLPQIKRIEVRTINRPSSQLMHNAPSAADDCLVLSHRHQQLPAWFAANSEVTATFPDTDGVSFISLTTAPRHTALARRLARVINAFALITKELYIKDYAEARRRNYLAWISRLYELHISANTLFHFRHVFNILTY